MANVSQRSRQTKNKHSCVLCCGVIFLFESRVKIADLDQQKKEALDASLVNNGGSVLSDSQNNDSSSGGTLCSACYQKLGKGSADPGIQGDRTQEHSSTHQTHSPTTTLNTTPNVDSQPQSSLNSQVPPNCEPSSTLRSRVRPPLSQPPPDAQEKWCHIELPSKSDRPLKSEADHSSMKLEADHVDGSSKSKADALSKTGGKTKRTDMARVLRGLINTLMVLPRFVRYFFMLFGTSEVVLAVVVMAVSVAVVRLGLGGDWWSVAGTGLVITALWGAVCFWRWFKVMELFYRFFGDRKTGTWPMVKDMFSVIWYLLKLEWLAALFGGRNAEEDAKEDDSEAIVAGSSLAGTTLLSLLQDGYSVNCGIELENRTRFHLVQPRVQLGRGTLFLAPSSVAPATREAMVARKGVGTVGTHGTVSWLIQPMQRRLVVMWSAPYNFDFFSNWLAVGLTSSGVTEHAPADQWYELMYRGGSTQNLVFEREEFYSHIRPVICRDDDFEVEGIMGSNHNAAVKVILRPRNPSNFAPCIRR